jgi:hypothetical protein
MASVRQVESLGKNGAQRALVLQRYGQSNQHPAPMPRCRLTLSICQLGTIMASWKILRFVAPSITTGEQNAMPQVKNYFSFNVL